MSNTNEGTNDRTNASVENTIGMEDDQLENAILTAIRADGLKPELRKNATAALKDVLVHHGGDTAGRFIIPAVLEARKRAEELEVEQVNSKGPIVTLRSMMTLAKDMAAKEWKYNGPELKDGDPVPVNPYKDGSWTVKLPDKDAWKILGEKYAPSERTKMKGTEPEHWSVVWLDSTKNAVVKAENQDKRTKEFKAKVAKELDKQGVVTPDTVRAKEDVTAAERDVHKAIDLMVECIKTLPGNDGSTESVREHALGYLITQTVNVAKSLKGSGSVRALQKLHGQTSSLMKSQGIATGKTVTEHNELPPEVSAWLASLDKKNLQTVCTENGIEFSKSASKAKLFGLIASFPNKAQEAFELANEERSEEPSETSEAIAS